MTPQTASAVDAATARAIRLVGIDVDGVLTDGGIYLGAVDGTPLEFKRYDIQDGLGIHFLRKAGIRVAIVTGRVSDSVRLRASELEIEDVAQDSYARKLPALRRILERHGIGADETAFIGDDFPDLAIMRTVRLPVAVANAVPEVLSVSRFQLSRGGGRGAVREFAELLLKARGEWETLTEAYVAERSVEGSDGRRGAKSKRRSRAGRGQRR
ncbi:MAG TPA: HAD hydrolase family protein [Gemmatimonadaceae bacterium]|jgi:3-deoxy-D-manno-octulosonate 8-phosphate phosphatase (KDO 8-P phosphatase)